MKKASERDFSREELLRAFGDTPSAFDDGLRRTLRRLSAQKEEKMKRKLALAPVLAIALTILLAATALAAALYPRTVERFRQSYGDAYADRLTRGDVADVDEGMTLDDVTFTITDVIYADGKLLGTVVMTPAPGARLVLMPEDAQESDLTADGKTTFAQAAEEKGARLAHVRCVPDGYELDGRVMSGEVGYFDSALEGGGVAASFEVCGWNGGVVRRESYTLCLWAGYCGQDREWTSATWRVTVTPEMKEAQVETTVPVDATGASVVTPAGFDGALPVYALTRRPLKASPERFNPSGVVKTTGGDSVYYLFNDEDELTVDAEGGLWYTAFEGTETIRTQAETGEYTEQVNPRMEPGSYAAVLLSHWRGRERSKSAEPPESRALPALSTITLAQAREQAQALLDDLGVADADCDWVYAGDRATLQALIDRRNAEIESGRLLNCAPWTQALTDADEGYALHYIGRVNGVPAQSAFLEAFLFINGEGVRFVSLSAPFARGEALAEETLISAADALSRAVAAAKNSWLSDLTAPLRNAQRIELIYAVREQATLSPAWRIVAKDDAKGGARFEVVVAADGTVLDAPWM